MWQSINLLPIHIGVRCARVGLRRTEFTPQLMLDKVLDFKRLPLSGANTRRLPRPLSFCNSHHVPCTHSPRCKGNTFHIPDISLAPDKKNERSNGAQFLHFWWQAGISIPNIVRIFRVGQMPTNRTLTYSVCINGLTHRAPLFRFPTHAYQK